MDQSTVVTLCLIGIGLLILGSRLRQRSLHARDRHRHTQPGPD